MKVRINSRVYVGIWARTDGKEELKVRIKVRTLRNEIKGRGEFSSND